MTKQLLSSIAILIVALVWLAVGFHFLYSTNDRVVKYNCDLAEISPDFPVEVKEQCRKNRSGRI